MEVAQHFANLWSEKILRGTLCFVMHVQNYKCSSPHTALTTLSWGFKHGGASFKSSIYLVSYICLQKKSVCWILGGISLK